MSSAASCDWPEEPDTCSTVTAEAIHGRVRRHVTACAAQRTTCASVDEDDGTWLAGGPADPFWCWALAGWGPLPLECQLAALKDAPAVADDDPLARIRA
jgi:hypothetical protein